MSRPHIVMNYSGQPARLLEDGTLEVLVGPGRWIATKRVSKREYDLRYSRLVKEPGTKFGGR